jgi:hypothetical protein
MGHGTHRKKRVSYEVQPTSDEEERAKTILPKSENVRQKAKQNI